MRWERYNQLQTRLCLQEDCPDELPLLGLAACLLVKNPCAVAVKTTWMCANFMHVVLFSLFHYSKKFPGLAG